MTFFLEITTFCGNETGALTILNSNIYLISAPEALKIQQCGLPWEKFGNPDMKNNEDSFKQIFTKVKNLCQKYEIPLMIPKEPIIKITAKTIQLQF